MTFIPLLQSVVRYDKFDSISLPLPEIKNPGLSLGHLLSEYIAAENLTDVTCESCNETCNHTKSVTFAKVNHKVADFPLDFSQHESFSLKNFSCPPACASIFRATLGCRVDKCWNVRITYIFPKVSRWRRIVLFSQVSVKYAISYFTITVWFAWFYFHSFHSFIKASTPWGSTMSLFSSSLQLNNAGLSGSDSFSSYTFGGMFPRNLYRLLAVVVHSGEANGGHFVTYRRGALRNSHR